MAWTEERVAGWKAGWRDAQGVKRSKSGFRTRAAAGRYAAQQEGASRQGEASYQARSMTWNEWHPQWLALAERVAPSTAHRRAYQIDAHLVPKWGAVPIAKIDRTDVQTWVNEMIDSGKAASTVQQVYRLLSTSLLTAVDHGKLGATPCVRIKVPKPAAPTERYLTQGEFKRVVAHLDEPFNTFARILVETGMRFGEVAGLHWQNVSLDGDNPFIMVTHSWDPTGTGAMKPVKNEKPRKVLLTTRMVTALRALADDDTRTTCGHVHTKEAEGCWSGLVLHTGGTARSRGGKSAADPNTQVPFDHHNFLNRHWKMAMAYAGVPYFKPHGLRHTAASWLLQGGARLDEVMATLGHESPATTKRYAKHGTDYGVRVRDVMELTAGDDDEQDATRGQGSAA